MREVVMAAAILAMTAVHGADAQSKVDETGRLEHIALGKGWLPVQTDVRVPLKGWGRILSLSEVKPAVESSRGRRTWRAALGDAGKSAASVEQTVTETDGKLVFEISAVGKGELDSEGVFFWIDVPANIFAGGSYRTGAAAGAAPASGTLPVEFAEPYHLCNAVTDKLILTDRTGKSELTIELGTTGHLLLQDARKWAQHFSVLVDVHAGQLPKGATARQRITLSTKGEIESKPAALTVDTSKVRYSITGVGGNYCFNIESPVTRYTLDNLKVAFARTEMTLEQWEPQNDNDDPAAPDWKALVAADKPGSRLRNEFEIMAELARKKIPFSATIWRLPAWLYTKPPTKENMNNRFAPEQWPEVLECIATYLQYAKEKYAAEADYFSFNEPNIGCRVAFNAEEHRDAVKRIGAHLASKGLKTKMLLGDVAGPRDTIKYVLPVTQDAEALKYAGAVSFHSWGGATPQQYNAWGDLAEKLKLPLIIAEAGVDPGAWNGARYRTFEYGVREVQHYQELFLHARPQAVLLWEFTGDYALLNENRFDRSKVLLTERFCFQKHWCDLIPAGSEALTTTSDNPDVLLTAFRFTNAGGPGFSFHLANVKWARPVTVTGLPAGVKTLNAVRTSRGEMFARLEPIPVTDGKCTLDLAGQSLTTLTTLTIPELKQP
jgi:O-glycosyl hydrolase